MVAGLQHSCRRMTCRSVAPKSRVAVLVDKIRRPARTAEQDKQDGWLGRQQFLRRSKISRELRLPTERRYCGCAYPARQDQDLRR